MKILYLSFEGPKDKTGVGRKIAAQIKYWRKEGEETRHIQLRHVEGNEVIQKYTKNNTLNLLLNLKNLKKAISDYKPDIIYMREILYVPFFLRALNATPYCIEINSDAKEDYKKQSWKKNLYYLKTHEILKKKAAGIVCVSKELVERLDISKETKSLVLANGYDFDEVSFSLVPESETISLIFVGSALQSWSGVENIEVLAKALPKYNFHLVGDGLDSSLPNIITYDYLNSASLRELYNMVDIGIGTFGLYKKGMNEASPLKIREYIAHGLPVILPFKDTDLSRFHAEHGILNIPNAPIQYKETIENIKGFCEKWKGRRINVEALQQILSYSSKEKKRLAFFREIIEKD